MKIRLGIFAIVATLGIGSAVQASEFYDFDSKALKLLNEVFKNCPIEFIQAMKGANQVSQATFGSDRVGEVISIRTELFGYFPEPTRKPIAVLHVSKKRIVTPDTNPEKPPQFDVTCQLRNPEKPD